MSQPLQFNVTAIPLSRPEIVPFLLNPDSKPRGVELQVVGQRPSVQAEARWLAQLQATTEPTVADLLAIDDPHGYLIKTHTDRLVPVQFLAESHFLTKNLGGWAPIYLNVVGLPSQWPDDPLLNQAEILTAYGSRIPYFGANPDQVAARLEDETDSDSHMITLALIRLNRVRQQMGSHQTAYIERLYAELASGTGFATPNDPPIPAMLLYDELLGQLVQVELSRRTALAGGDEAKADTLKIWQSAQAETTGLRLILKGEYIMGRHRRSTVLLAPELGAVVKQPAPEPFHEIKLNDREFDGKKENWPYTTHNGSLVTPRGRLRLIVEEGLLPRLGQTLGHNVRFSTLLGLTIEPFVEGKTVQQLVLDEPDRMKGELYELFVLHQQVCEAMDIENGDWHAANFMLRRSDGHIVHIDWGAARPLRQDELTPEGKLARLNQVQNIAYSFHDQELAKRVLQLHAELMADQARLANIEQQARRLVER